MELTEEEDDDLENDDDDPDWRATPLLQADSGMTMMIILIEIDLVLHTYFELCSESFLRFVFFEEYRVEIACRKAHHHHLPKYIRIISFMSAA